MKKLLYFLLGAAILSIAVVFAIESNVGLGPFDALSANGSALYGVSIGMAMNIHLLILLVILLIMKPSYMYFVGTLLSFSIGIFVDVFSQIITLPDLGFYSVSYFIIALPFFPIGVAMMINSSMPIGPIEKLPLVITDITNISFTITKTAIEVIYVLIALTFSLLAGIGIGSIMIGTIVLMFYIGPSISYCRNILPKIKDTV